MNNNDYDNDNYNLSIKERVNQTLNELISSPDMLMRLLLVLTITVVFIGLCFLVGLKWMIDVFNPTVDVPIGDYLFKATIIGTIFGFYTGVVYFLVKDCRPLHFTIMLLSFLLIFASAAVMVEISNRCILDLDCDVWKYSAGLAMVTAILMAGFLLPKLVYRSAAAFGNLFLAVALWQSVILLITIDRTTGVKPTPGALRAVSLLLYTISILLISFTSLKKSR